MDPPYRKGYNVANYDQLVWDIGAILPDETQVEICDWVAAELKHLGVDMEDDIPEGEVPAAASVVHNIFRRALNHKRGENQRFPSDQTAALCDALEDTLTDMQPIEA